MPLASGSFRGATAVLRVRQHAKVSVNRIGRWVAQSVGTDSTWLAVDKKYKAESILAARVRLPQPELRRPSGLLKRPGKRQRAESPPLASRVAEAI